MKLFLMAFTLFLASCGPAPISSGEVEFRAIYAYATTKVQKNGTVFLSVTNGGPENTRIISASASVAERIELHTHIMDGDVMMMREVEGYDIPAGGTVTLEPTGHHIMLIGLKAPLEGGDIFDLTLHFENGAERSLVVCIRNPGDVE